MVKLHPNVITITAILVAGLFVAAAPALAIHPEEKSEIENLKKRIELLESQQAETGSDEQGEGVDFGRINRYVTLHGLLEAEATYVKPHGGDDESDLNLATAELSIEVVLNEMFGGHLTLLAEDVDGEDDSVEVDEAVISLTAPMQLAGQTPSLHVGRMYVPFGMFNSTMVSDPLTLELGESSGSAALFALEGDVWTFKTGVFNGGTDLDGEDDQIDTWVAALEVTPVENLAFGVSFISDLAESDNGLVRDESLYSDDVAGISAFLSAHCGRFGFEAEYLAALDDFDAPLVMVGEDLTGRRPQAWNLELAWMPTERLQLAARVEEARDFQDDVRRYGATVSYGLHEHVVVALEYLHAEADVDEDDPVDMLTAQLALEF